MPHRYFTNELAAGRAALTGSDAHHLADVMRAKLGEEVVLCGPDGLEYLGTVTAIQSGRVEFTVTKGTTSKAEPDAGQAGGSHPTQRRAGRNGNCPVF